MSAPVVVNVVRELDCHVLIYRRTCSEEELDGVLAEEENEYGRVVSLDISPPA